MKVKVYAPGFCSYEKLDEDNMMELKEGSTLNDVLKNLSIPLPLRPLLLPMVNYKRVKLNAVLNDSDIISFFAPLAGG
jgi:molybdopterin converting factor small subunit